MASYSPPHLPSITPDSAFEINPNVSIHSACRLPPRNRGQHASPMTATEIQFIPTPICPFHPIVGIDLFKIAATANTVIAKQLHTNNSRTHSGGGESRTVLICELSIFITGRLCCFPSPNENQPVQIDTDSQNPD